jgi:flagellum-specific peptidoglycan hydrolase FlgJ
MSANVKEQVTALHIIAPLASKCERLYGVPAEMTTAQAMIESQWMKSVIGKHNCYGMKRASRHKLGVVVRTEEILTDAQLKSLRRKIVSKTLAPDGRWDVVIEDEFADYPSYEDSVKDYCWLISSGSPYAAAWRKYMSNSYDWKSLAQNIATTYATGRDYGQLIIAVASIQIVREAIEVARKIGKQ